MKLNKDTGQFILYGVLALVVLYLVYKLFLKKSVTEKSVGKSDDAIDEYIQQSTSGSDQNTIPTKTRGEWGLIAETIYSDLKYSRIADDHGDAIYQLARPKNDADVATLIDLFGKRQEYSFGIPIGEEQNLAQFVRGNLSTSEINIINDNYSRKKIKFRW